MKRSVFVMVPLLTAAFLGCRTAKAPDPVEDAKKANARVAYENSVREHVAQFLVKIADARMMDMKEGEQAVKRGTAPLIREYGALMIKDQRALLTKIQNLAAERGLTLPSDISESKRDGLQQLSDTDAAKFDAKFIKMMIIDHERDVDDFKDAISLKDKEISRFASSNLPIIESHLMKAKKIQEGQ